MKAALFLISRTLKYKQLAVRSFVLGIFAFIYAIILALPLLLFISAARRLSLSCEVVHGAINTPQHARSLNTADKLEGENK